MCFILSDFFDNFKYHSSTFFTRRSGIPEEICLRYNPGDAFTVAGEIMGEPKEAK